MSVEIEGTHNMLRKIREQYGEARLLKVQDKALRRGSNYFVSVLKQNFEVFKDTGGSIEEVSVTEPHYIYGNTRMIKVYWSGSLNRYSIIHINEWGSIKKPNPRGKGAIARTMFTTEKPYRQIIKDTLKEEL
ncbi:hypothetical protein [Staphylococcus saprophyticus]|uniref:hypothetical protein n=1 Tax=Staphylococcus saprophyticus TaxID=29385 RepID=UPI0012AE87CF|nr:hypothetical protein [Staphylococcus saprophyticus]MDW4153335.1 hypothetical protein [Staphylococcus saprophyticus]MDW4184284.1 hypothetical protein [Staphylococcus saprophyticus]MDW4352514.1 hypothetical protein [Staphylococcus saprophyticus]MDW4460813.1 hypothetical protein [Staphylococcus saprophyticus]MDW4468283.1 hypothetical protein [Staphylococcus saprophyticus]